MPRNRKLLLPNRLTGIPAGPASPPAEKPAKRGPARRFLLAAIRFYRKRISPGRPPCCRFVPTCSQYALEAVEKYGALRGGWLALRRLLRCNPFYKGDLYDPVP